jgi:magnesium chelatase subunit I
VATIADGYFSHLDTHKVVEWFDLGGTLQLADTMSAAAVLEHAGQVQGLVELAQAAGVPKNAPAPLLAAGVDFALEGLYALKKISRSEERGYHATEAPVRRPSRHEREFDESTPLPGGSKKKYYN